MKAFSLRINQCTKKCPTASDLKRNDQRSSDHPYLLLSCDVSNTVSGSTPFQLRILSCPAHFKAKLLKAHGVQYSLWAHSVQDNNVLSFRKDESVWPTGILV